MAAAGGAGSHATSATMPAGGSLTYIEETTATLADETGSVALAFFQKFERMLSSKPINAGLEAQRIIFGVAELLVLPAEHYPPSALSAAVLYVRNSVWSLLYQSQGLWETMQVIPAINHFAFLQYIVQNFSLEDAQIQTLGLALLHSLPGVSPSETPRLAGRREEADHDALFIGHLKAICMSSQWALPIELGILRGNPLYVQVLLKGGKRSYIASHN